MKKSTARLINTNQIVLVGVFALLSLSNLCAQSWGDGQDSGVRESASTAAYTSGRHAFDGSKSTYWQLASGSSSGWAELYGTDPRRYGGASVTCNIPEGATLSVSALEDGAWVLVPGGIVTGSVDGTARLFFPGELPPTDRVLFSLDGQNADQARVYDIELASASPLSPFKKILPRSYTTNFAEYINIKASRLWDGIASNAWYEPLWSIPWEPMQTDTDDKPTSIFPPYMGPPSSSGQIVWTLDGTYAIQLVKAYLINAQRSIRIEFWVNDAWSSAVDLGDQWTAGWQRAPLPAVVSTNKIRITFPQGWEFARFIGEIQVWGEGFSDIPSRPLPLTVQDSSGARHGSVDGVDARNYELSAVVPGTISSSIISEWNGKAISLDPIATVSGSTLVRGSIPATLIQSGQQYLKIAESISGVSLDAGEDSGRISLGMPWDNGFFDQSANASTTPALKAKTWNFGRSYQLEKLRVYSSSVNGLSFQTALGSAKRVVSWTNTGSGYWEADLSGIAADSLIFSSSIETYIDQIQLYGTPMTDASIGMEVWWPRSSPDKPVTSSAGDGNSVIGWMGNPSVQATVNGTYCSQADKLFWVPLSRIGLTPSTEKIVTITGNLGSISTSLPWDILWTPTTQATLTQGTALVSTTSSSILISGTVNSTSQRVFVNGAEVALVGKTYSTTVPLAEGYQVITVEVWNSQKSTLIESFKKPVYRAFGVPSLVFDLPRGDLWSQSATINLTGRVGNGPGLSVLLNGASLQADSGKYSTQVALTEGTNDLAFALTDSLGRSATSTLRVFRDQAKPVISIAAPTEGQYLASSAVTFTIQSETDSQLWWRFGVGPWESQPTNPEQKTIVFADGFYTECIQAQDRAGNISDPAEVSFVVDTAPPEPFAVNANVSDWTSNNEPTLSFGTTDATSGLDRYMYATDGGLAEAATSPLILPTLSDGIHTVTVFAFDKSGNLTTSSITLQMDTSAPPTPAGIIAVPGQTSIATSWTGVDDGESFQSYMIERDPAWSDGARSIAGTSYGSHTYTDTGLTQGEVFSYRTWAVDRAGNVSAKTEWVAAEVGLASATVNPTATTVVQYYKLSASIPPRALASNITQVKIAEIPVEDIVDPPTYGLVSKIYEFMVSRVDDGIEQLSDQALLSSPATIQIWYDQTAIPDGLGENSLKPYYYDILWGQWIPVPDACVDTSRHSILFKTDHFTEYCVMADQGIDISAGQAKDGVASPFATRVGQSPIVASPEGGTVSTSFTEAVLPGKNNFDLVLSRAYSTSTAQSDALSLSINTGTPIEEDRSNTTIDGSIPWKMGYGWRLSFPFMKWNGSGLFVTDVDGRTISLGQMEEIVSDDSDGGRVITMENHEGSDGTFVATFSVSKHTKKILWIFPNGETTTYAFESAAYYMKDGRVVTFDSLGRVTSLKDSSRNNAITFSYTENMASSIKDTMGRMVSFAYEPGRIKAITVTAGSSTLETSYDYTNGKLTKATDCGGRAWNYSYEDIPLVSKSSLRNPPSGYKDADPSVVHVSALSTMSGPGIGSTSISYSTKIVSYVNNITENGNWTFDILYSRLYASTIDVALDTDSQPLRRTTYQYEIKNNDTGNTKNQYYTSTSTIDDGRMIRTTNYTGKLMTRTALSSAPEAYRKAFDFTVGTKEEPGDVVTIDPVSILRKEGETKAVETRTQKWNTTTLSVKSDSLKRDDDNYRDATYTYDGWGNVIYKQETETVGTRSTTTTSTTTYYNTGSLSLLVSDSPAGLTLEESDLDYGQKNLLAEMSIEATGSDTANSITSDNKKQYVAYTYDTLGRVSTKEMWTGSGTGWVSTSYDSYDDYSQLTQTTGSTGQVTTFAYDYDHAGDYRITTVKKSVMQADGTTRDIATEQGYDVLTGANTWSIDARGYATERAFDKLGRITKIIEPADTDTPQPKVPTDTTTWSRSSDPHPTTVIVYNDDSSAVPLSSTVTTPLSATIVYQFDNLGRLSSTAKTTTILSSLYAGETDSETLNTQMTYDGFDQLLSIIGPWSSLETERPETRYTYDSRGRVASVRAPGAMAARTSVYDDANNTVTSVDEAGNQTIQTLDWSGRTLSSTRIFESSDNNIVTQAFYDGFGRAIAVIDANKNRSTISYNEIGLKSVVRGQPRDVNGATVTPELYLYYDAKESLRKTSQALDGGGTRLTTYTTNGIGQVLETSTDATVNGTNQTVFAHYAYDIAGNLASQESGYQGGATAKKAWTYDSHSRVLTQVDEENNVTSYAYDAAGNRTSVVDPREGKCTGNFTIDLTYDQLSRLIEADLPSVDAAQRPSLYFFYDGRGNLLEKQETDGKLSSYDYTIRGLLQKETITDGATSYSATYEYDDAGRLWKTTSPSGRIDYTFYDKASRVVRQGNETAGYTQASYDKNGNQTTVTDGEGNTTTYTYSPDNLVATMKDAKGSVTTAEYDRWGQKIQTIDAEENERRYAYDEIGRLIAESTPWYSGGGYNLTYSYDAWGNVTSQTDARGTTFERTYTKTSRLAMETATNGATTETATFDYDEAGDLKTANNGVLTQYNLVNGAYQPDPYGLTTGKIDLVGATTLAMGFGYDQKQRLTSVTYPNAETASYTYNQLDQLTTMPGWISGSLAYDTAGHLTGFTLANGAQKTIAYDSQDRLAGLGYSAAGTDLASYTFTYDKASNIISKNQNSYSYDKLNQLIGTSEKGWFQKKPSDLSPTLTTKDRDYLGTKILSFNAPATTEIALDSASRSVGVDLGAVYGVNKIELHPANASHRVRQQDLSIYISLDNAQASSDPEMSDYTKVTDLTMAAASDGVLTLTFPTLFEARYIKITTIWDDRDIDNTSIDSFSTFKNSPTELVKVWALVKNQNQTYEYDSIGNRTKLTVDGETKTIEYYQNQAGGNLSWIKYDGEWYYQYDQAGNRTVKAKALLAGTANQEPIDTSQEYWTYAWDLHNRLAAVSKNGTQIVAYTYDTENFRVRRIGSDGTTIYAYDRMGSLIYQKNETSGFERSIAYLGGEVIGWTETVGGTTTKYYAVTDHLGSVTKVLDASAKVVWQSEYTAFGTVAGAQGSLSFSGMYAGKDLDPDTGLTYHWNRWRSEDGSTFISEDPIQDGTNFYGYAGNSPLCFLDPTGLTDAAPGMPSYVEQMIDEKAEAEEKSGSEGTWSAMADDINSKNYHGFSGSADAKKPDLSSTGRLTKKQAEEILDYLRKQDPMMFEEWERYRRNHMPEDAIEDNEKALMQFLEVVLLIGDLSSGLGIVRELAKIGAKTVAEKAVEKTAKEFAEKFGKEAAEKLEKEVAEKVPGKATNTLKTIRETGKAPEGFKGGRTFENDGRNGGEVLPKTDAAGNPITYQEWDVNPFQKGINRGDERIVTGSDGSARFTENHYQSFTRME